MNAPYGICMSVVTAVYSLLLALARGTIGVHTSREAKPHEIYVPKFEIPWECSWRIQQKESLHIPIQKSVKYLFLFHGPVLDACLIVAQALHGQLFFAVG